MSVSPTEYWRRLDALFQAALDLPAEERDPFIARESVGDPALGRELREMLACASGAANRIAGAVGAAAQHALAAHEWIGRRVGSYRILREIGRGGMGIVFEAARDDGVSHQRVAIKAGCGIDERFRTERQILAGLEHPHIARFLDGGSERGVPYLVMEFVEGRPITDWCDERKLSLRRRIELFRLVCDAVHYAHENMIVHRDLKPANILVSRAGEPKLLDFGIAKLLGPGDVGGTTGMRLWTPDYTSPEQVRGGNVTVRTDVYSLGLILYELLCGERAQTSDWSSPLALDRSICEQEPPAPSVRADARELRGDLDMITAMAMRKEPERRYASAAALSADLGRYLDSRPVEARPSTATYRLLKLVRRHRLATASAILLAASIAGGVASTVHQARVAERRFEQVRGIANAFIFDVHDRIMYLPGATEARRAIVATALRYLENVRREAGADAALRLELAAAYERIGDVQGEPSRSNLGDSQGALASFRSAEQLLTPLYKAGDLRAGVPLASALLKVGTVHAERSENATSDLGQAHEIILWVLSHRPTNRLALKVATDIDSTIVRQGLSARDTGRVIPFAEEAMRMAEQLVALDPGNIETRDYLSQAHSALGSAYRTTLDLERSAQSYRAAVKIREQLVREQPESAGYQRNLMVGYGHLGDALGPPRNQGLGDYEGAADALRKAVAIAQWLCRTDPADRKARFDLANADYRLGSVLMPLEGRIDEALSALHEAETILADLQKQDPANGSYSNAAVYTGRKAGEALTAAGRYREAAARMTAAISLAEKFRGTRREAEGKNGALAAMVGLAKIKAMTGDRSAITMADDAAARLDSSHPQPDQLWGHATMFADLGDVYRRMGRLPQAASYLAKSAQLWSDMKVPAALEGQRKKELAAVNAVMASLH